MLLALPFTALAQSTAPESFKGANKIEIFTGLTFEENYTLVGRTLIEKDYELDVRDKEFGLITTKHKGFKFMLGANEGVYYLKFVVQNEKIVLTGEFSLGTVGYTQTGVLTYQPEFSPASFDRITNFGGGSKNAFSKTYSAM